LSAPAVVTGDSWTSIALALSEPEYDEDGNRLQYFDTGPSFFLGSFVVVVGWVLFNVVMAVMLEAFLEASNKNKHERDKELTMNVQHQNDRFEGKRDARVSAIDPGYFVFATLCLWFLSASLSQETHQSWKCYSSLKTRRTFTSSSRCSFMSWIQMETACLNIPTSSVAFDILTSQVLFVPVIEHADVLCI